MATHTMLDIETLDTSPTAQILTIGACRFDPNKKSNPVATYYVRLNIDEQEKIGRTINENTLRWWGQQSKEVIEDTFADERTDIKTALLEFREFVLGSSKVWAQGPQFDMVMIESLYKQYNMNHPWSHSNVMDSRTLFKLMPEDPRDKYTFEAHNALQDAIFQAKCVQDCVQHFGLTL